MKNILGVEDKIFTPHEIYFIGNSHHINKLWILEKCFLKPKKAQIHKMMPKPMVQNPWRYCHIKTHSSSSWHAISFSAYDPSSWVSLGEFWELWFGGQEICSVKLQWFKVDKGKHVTWHVFPNSLNSDKSVCNR